MNEHASKLCPEVDQLLFTTDGQWHDVDEWHGLLEHGLHDGHWSDLDDNSVHWHELQGFLEEDMAADVVGEVVGAGELTQLTGPSVLSE